MRPIREKREEIAKDMNKVNDILKSGTKKAIEISNQTLKEVKQAMKINYFE